MSRRASLQGVEEPLVNSVRPDGTDVSLLLVAFSRRFFCDPRSRRGELELIRRLAGLGTASNVWTKTHSE